MLKGQHKAHGTASSPVFLLMGMNGWGGGQPCTGFIPSKRGCRLQAGEAVIETPGHGKVENSIPT